MAIPLSVVLLYLAFELGVGLKGSKNRPFSAASDWTGAVLVPAHNEALGIENTVRALRKAAPRCRILVVADNCSDETASLARAAGAETISRVDNDNRGKGFALAFGRDHLALNPPDVVIVVDADCELSAGSADRLIATAVISGAPVQSRNLLVGNAGDSPLVSISNFAMLIKNLVRARGLYRIGGGALLFGTGMAFPWKLFAGLELGTSHAVEDIQLGLSLARKGVRVVFEDSALVTSAAASVDVSKGQRSRWEHGFLKAALDHGIPMLSSGLRHRSRHLFAIGAHMMVPPLALLIALSVLALCGLMLLSNFFENAAALLVLFTSLVIATLALLAAWWCEGRTVLQFKTLLMIPFYVIWKIPIYVGYFISRQTDWNRTQREGERP
ncbi:MAG: glycosyltransferase family 2 protein [Sphingorhabdus sp.]